MRSLTPLRIAALIGLVSSIQLGACAAKQQADAPAGGQAQETTGADADGVPAAPPGPAVTQQHQMPNFSVSSAVEDLDRSEKEVDLALADKDAAGQPLATGDRCTNVCKALSSMRRAADQICGIDATRCADARARVTKAEQRAKDACPACATPT